MTTGTHPDSPEVPEQDRANGPTCGELPSVRGPLHGAARGAGRSVGPGQPRDPQGVPSRAASLQLRDGCEHLRARRHAALAPYVRWLRELHRRPAAELALAQAVAAGALEQLGSADLARASWPQLQVLPLLLATRRSYLPPPPLGDLRLAVSYLLKFLSAHNLLRHDDCQRLRRQLRLARPPRR